MGRERFFMPKAPSGGHWETRHASKKPLVLVRMYRIGIFELAS